MKNILVKTIILTILFSTLALTLVTNFAEDVELQTTKKYEAEAGAIYKVKYVKDRYNTPAIEMNRDGGKLFFYSVPNSKSITIVYDCINVVKGGKTIDGKLSFYIDDTYVQDIIFPHNPKKSGFDQIKLDIDIPEGSTISFRCENDYSKVQLDYIEVEFVEPKVPRYMIKSTSEGRQEAHNEIILGMREYKSVIDVSKYNITSSELNYTIGDLSLYNQPALYHLKKLNMSLNEGPYKTIYETEITPDGKTIKYAARVYPQYSMESKEYFDISNKYEASIEKMLASIPKNASTIEKIMVVNDYIASITRYSTKGPSKYSSLGVYVDGLGVCKAYALAFIEGMNRIGVESKYIVGNNSNHAWAMVKLENEWYHVDPTWNDTTNRSHKYFLLSDIAIKNKGHYDWYAMVGVGKSSDAPKATNTKYDNSNWDEFSNYNTKSPESGDTPLDSGDTLLENETDSINKTEEKTIISNNVAKEIKVNNISIKAIITKPSASKVRVNNNLVSFESYNINGNNYFKLRDLAKVISGTNKQFSVEYNEKNAAIDLVSGKSYTSVGGELSIGNSKSKNAISSESKIYINGKESPFIVYTIEGNNYFKLRDITEAFNIGVGYDTNSKEITIDTKLEYAAELSNDKVVRIEGENGKFVGNVRVDNQTDASGGKIVSYLENINDSASFSNIPASSGFTIAYTRGNSGSGKLALYINDVHLKDIVFDNTGGWQSLSSLYVDAKISENSNIKFVIESDSSAVNIDYLDFSIEK